MITEISIDEYFSKKQPATIIDVRTPGEFEKGHIPGAYNIPIFSNEERAKVGTVYVQDSKEKAIALGYKIVKPKLQWFLDESRNIAGDSPITVHCWRGGMRSHAFAEHLLSNGFSNVSLITKGYKAFRNHVLDFFEQPFQLRIIGGFTGCGKTWILKAMKELGEQTIDLEGVAHHKGSAFGAIGESAQPTVEQFENNLFDAFRIHDLKSPIWIEDESHNIGYIQIPISLFRQMREQNLYFLDIPKELRAHHLVEEYSSFGNDLLAKGINGIAKRMGGQNVQAAHEFLAQNNYYEVTMLALNYYDKAYGKGVSSRNPEKVINITLSGMNHFDNAKSIIKSVNEYERDKTHSI